MRVRGKLLDKVVETYALLDNGSDVSLCDRNDLVVKVLLNVAAKSFCIASFVCHFCDFRCVWKGGELEACVHRN